LTFPLGHAAADGTFDRSRPRRHLRARSCGCRDLAAEGWREIITARSLARARVEAAHFFASAQAKFSGPIEAQRHPHLHDRASQEAARQAVVHVSGVDFSSAAALNAVP
jgi:hypothetical protein